MAMTDVLTDARAELLREGLDAECIARALLRVRMRWGGSSAYVLKRDREQTDAEIMAELAGGTPTNEIAQKIGLSRSTIRRRASKWL
jgi:DNA invertase Pin-like site-specific DNA recombinase